MRERSTGRTKACPIRLRFLLTLTMLVLLSWSCAGTDPESVATFDGGSLSISDLDAHLRSLPAAEQSVPAGAADAEWLEEKIRDAAETAVLNGLAEQRMATPEAIAAQRWAVETALSEIVLAELRATTKVDEEQLGDLLQQQEAPAPRPRYDFRHVFLRHGPTARDQAQQLLQEARSGSSFEELARAHSQSETAADGGLVLDQRPRALDPAFRVVLERLEEGEISPVVETRTGFHIVQLARRLVPAPEPQGSREQALRARLHRQALAARYQEEMAKLRGAAAGAFDEFPWQLGDVTVESDDLVAMTGSSEPTPQERSQWTDRLLLAQEARRSGHLTPELQDAVGRRLRHAAVTQVRQERMAQFLVEIPLAEVAASYEARPSAFALPGSAHLELIFVEEGRDTFATLLEMERHVAALRSGASFEKLAKSISTGPGAAEGGDLGFLSPDEWVRLNPAIYEAVNRLQPEEISDPVYLTGRLLTNDTRTLRGGYAILRLRERRQPQPRSLEEAANEVRSAWARQNPDEFAKLFQEALLKEAGFRLHRIPDLPLVVP